MMLSSSSSRRLLSSSASLASSPQLFFLHSNNQKFDKKGRQIVIKRNFGYKELSEKPSDDTAAFPWRSIRVKQSLHKPTVPHPLHVAAYNPKGKGVRPPWPLLMIPGLTTNYRIFSQICRHLNYPYGVLSMDLRGRGFSQLKSDETLLNIDDSDVLSYPLAEHAKDVVRTLNFFHTHMSFIVGFDYGGLVALKVAKEYRDRCCGVVLIDSGFNSNHSIPENVLKGFEKEISHLSQKFNSVPEYLQQWEQYQSKPLNFDAKEMFSFDIREDKQTKSFLHRAKLDYVENDYKRLNSELMSLEDFEKLKIPVAIVRAQNGFTSSESPIMNTPLYNSLISNLEVHDVYTANDANHYSMMWEPEHGANIANLIDNFVAPYDKHRNMQHRFERIKFFGRTSKKSQQPQAKSETSEGQISQDTTKQ